MFCPKCGKINPDNHDLCSNCGAVLREGREDSPMKKNANLKAVLTILLIIAVIAATIVLLNGCDPGNIMQDNVTF